MINPILNMLNASNKQQAPASQTPLPTSMDDPRMADAKNYVASHGGNPQAAFYQLCQEKMLNPANVINMILGGR